MAYFIIVLVASFHLLNLAVGSGVCQKATVSSSFYVADDAVFHYNTAFIVEFVLKCQNGVQDLSLYAEINGRLLPVSLSMESNRYQISWTEEHEKAPSGTYTVNIHDEDGYATIRKAQRNNDDISSIQPLASIDVSHKGPQKGPLAQSQMLAIAIASVVYYIAYSWKAKIQS